MKDFGKIISLISLFLLFPVFTFSAIINVPADQLTIQAGIDAANDGDTIVVMPGIYEEIVDFSGKAVCLTSAYGADSTIVTFPTRITNLIKFTNGEDTSSVLDGFTIQNVSHDEGVIRLLSSSATIRNCKFIGNTNFKPSPSSWGVIAHSEGGYLIAENNYFEDNHSYSAAGIGISCGQARIENNIFYNNEAFGDFGGAIGIGGIWCHSTVFIHNNLFVSNSAPHGGAVFLSENDNSIVTNNTFVENSSNDGGGICIWYYSSGLVITNNIFMNNSGHGITNQYGSSASFNNNDLFMNTPDNYLGDVTPGICSISADPLFCDAYGFNYTLFENSPCSQSNNMCGELIGAYDIGCVYEEPKDILIITSNNQHSLGQSRITEILQNIPADLYFNPTSYNYIDYDVVIGDGNMWNSSNVTDLRNYIINGGNLVLTAATPYYLTNSSTDLSSISDIIGASNYLNGYDYIILADDNPYGLPFMAGDTLGYANHVGGRAGISQPTETLSNRGYYAIPWSSTDSSLFSYSYTPYDGKYFYISTSWEDSTDQLFAAAVEWMLTNEILNAELVIEPNPQYYFYIYSMNTMSNSIYVGGFDISNIDINSISINNSISPSSTSILPSYEGFLDQVLKIDFSTKEFILGYGIPWDVDEYEYTVSGQMLSGNHFIFSDSVTIIGHRSGDANGDGNVDIQDITYTISYLYFEGPKPNPLIVVDVNNDNNVNILDISCLVRFLF